MKMQDFDRKRSLLPSDDHSTPKRIRTSDANDKVPLIDLTNGSIPQDIEPQEIPVLHPDEQYGVDHPEDPSWPLMPGARVFVKNKVYIRPAIICGLASKNTYNVYFVDKDIFGCVGREDIARLSILSYGTEVYCDGLIYHIEKVPEATDDWYDGIYVLKARISAQTIKASWDKLSLCTGADDVDPEISIIEDPSDKNLEKEKSDATKPGTSTSPGPSEDVVISSTTATGEWMSSKEPPTTYFDVFRSSSVKVTKAEATSASSDTRLVSITSSCETQDDEEREETPKKILYSKKHVQECQPGPSHPLTLKDILNDSYKSQNRKRRSEDNFLADEDILAIEETFYSSFSEPDQGYEKCKYCTFKMKIEEHPEIIQYFICKKCKAEFCRMCFRDVKDHAYTSCEDIDKKEKEVADNEAEQGLIEELIQEIYDTQSPNGFGTTCEDEDACQYYSEIFTKHFKFKLSIEKYEDLAKMYEICEKVPSIIKEFKRIFEDYIISESRTLIENSIQEILKTPKFFISTIHILHERFLPMIQNVFGNNPNFVGIFEEDGAFHKLIKNSIQNRAEPIKLEEILIRHCDAILKKASLSDQKLEKLEEELTKIALALKYVAHPILYYKFYYRTLAKRLINDLTVSYVMEGLMLIKLEEVFGNKFIEKWKTMITDAEISSALTKSYYQHVNGNGLLQTAKKALSHVLPFVKNPDDETDPENAPKISFKIITSGSWSISSENRKDWIIPKELSASLESFKNFYYSEHSNRKLTWNYPIFRADVGTNGTFDKPYLFITVIPQVYMLMLFNHDTSLMFAFLQQAMRLYKDELLSYLKLFFEIGLLKTENGETLESLTDDTTICINFDFKNPKSKIDLASNLGTTCFHRKLPSGGVQNVINGASTRKQKDLPDSSYNPDADRRYVIQAHIVKTIKAKKKMKHTDLLKAVQGVLKDRFDVSVVMFKKCIESLVQIEILSRSVKNKVKGKVMNLINGEPNFDSVDFVYEYIP